MKVVKRYKFLRKGMKSENGNQTWELGRWEKFDGELELCRAGFHCSKKPYHAFSSVQGEILALVECRGEHLEEGDKECWREQRVVKAWKWTKKDSLKLAIFSAERVFGIYEKEFPEDDRPRKAIEAAKKVLEKDTKKNRDAAEEAACAVRAAWAAAGNARDAAWAAAWAARDAAWAARAAAWAAWAAAGNARAAWAARDAAGAAAEAAIYKKIIKYFDLLVKDLEEL